MNFLEPEPAAVQKQSKTRRLVLAAAALLAAILLLAWYLFRFAPEKRAVEQFFDALAAGDMARAYQLWKPGPTYKMEDFLADWGPNGYYGPVKSYRIESASAPAGASGVIVSVEISPYSPFSAPEDVDKSRRTRRVRLWVETKDKSLSFPP